MAKERGRDKRKREDNYRYDLPATAVWIILNKMTNPFVEPFNQNSTLKSPTKIKGSINPKC